MKTRLKISLLLFFVFFTNVCFAGINNTIVARVENEIITSYEIKNRILNSLILANQDINQENINKLKRQSLESLIQLKLKKIELLKHEINYNSEQMTLYLNQISSNDIDGLKSKFKINNLDYELFYKQIETQLKWQRLIYKLYESKIEINDKDINDELKTVLQNQENIVEFNISEIEILINNNIDDGKLINAISKEIETQGFESAALRFSISNTAANKGNLGWVNANSLSKNIFKILSGMSVGEISKPFKRQNTVLFLKLSDKRESKSKNIDVSKLKINLINQRKNELFNLYSSSHLSKLKNSSFIEYK
jgi:peptidyl-prolyl cis-trans isomerase SurA